MFTWRPRNHAGWAVVVLGALALVMGALGVVSPDTQRELMGFASVPARAPGDYTMPVLAITSLAAINTAILYLVAGVRSWPGFVAYAVTARTIMGIGLLVLALSGRGPSAFVTAAVWEMLGALAIVAAGTWDHRRGSTHG